MSENSAKKFFSRVWEFIKRKSKAVWEYLKVAKMEWIVMISLFAFDLISKTIVEKTLGYGNSVTLIPNFLAFTLIANKNAAYGADFVSNWLGPLGARIFFSVFAVAASVAMILVLIRHKGRSKVFRIGIAMFVAGAMGNCIDRMAIGWVRDFVHFTFQPYIFNIADAELIFGVALIVIYFIFLYKDSGKRKDAPLTDELGALEPVDMTAVPVDENNGEANAEQSCAVDVSEDEHRATAEDTETHDNESADDNGQVNNDTRSSDGGDGT